MTERVVVNPVPPARRLFVNRTLNLRSIAAVGFDMDYTLIHYRVDEWEKRAYFHAKARLLALGFPVAHLEFSPGAFTLGLIVDRLNGNVVKANRFGFVKKAMHGFRALDLDEQRRVYSRTLVDLSERRWAFANTLFSLSETCLYAQLVELLDAGKLSPGLGYEDVFRAVRTCMDAAHMEGELKQEIARAPEEFVVLDEELPLFLRDLRQAGKKLLLITNSEWSFVQSMMSYAFDRYVPDGWRSLFDVVIVEARKPDFFSGAAPIFNVVSDDGLLRTHVGKMREGGLYLGGNARLVEALLDRPGEQILYVGDHIFADVHVTKNLLRWRTALIIRELEDEIEALAGFQANQDLLDGLMRDKERLEHAYDERRLLLQRQQDGYGPRPVAAVGVVRREMQELRVELERLDDRVAPLSKMASELGNASWGLLLRAGNDKSHLARQVERYADVYTSRVSNFLNATPFAFLRSPRGSLPHDPLPKDDD